MPETIVTLAESPRFLLRHSYESVVLLDKITNTTYNLGEHYGDPEIGLIAPDESWFVTAGEGLLYFDFTRGLQVFFRSGFQDHLGRDTCAFVHAARIMSGHEVRVLLDPWSPYASTWVLNTASLKVARVCDGPQLMDQPWQEKVDY